MPRVDISLNLRNVLVEERRIFLDIVRCNSSEMENVDYDGVVVAMRNAIHVSPDID